MKELNLYKFSKYVYSKLIGNGEAMFYNHYLFSMC